MMIVSICLNDSNIIFHTMMTVRSTLQNNEPRHDRVIVGMIIVL
jgi:hypothetical protein